MKSKGFFREENLAHFERCLPLPIYRERDIYIQTHICTQVYTYVCISNDGIFTKSFLFLKLVSTDIINYDPNMFCESLKTRDIVVYCKRFFLNCNKYFSL